MKAAEAARIQGLLAARRPPVMYKDATIEGVRMLVIIGEEVDTVIRFTRGGSADMPQISSYPEIAEAAVYADDRLAKQRASGRLNTTGEGSEWPRDWKLDRAMASGKIWYFGPKPNRLGRASSTTPRVRLSHTAPTQEELVKAHEVYRQTVPNNYAAAIRKVAASLSTQDLRALAEAISEWLRNINGEYYKRWHPDEALTLTDRLEPVLRQELPVLVRFRQRSISTLHEADRGDVLRLFARFRRECGPVGAAKALHPVAPNFFPLWDTKIADGYSVPKDDAGYLRFINMVKEQVQNLPQNVVPDVTALKVLDEYNYLRMSAKPAACA